MVYMNDPFINFKKSLSQDEKMSIKSWLGVGYDLIRHYQLTGQGESRTIECAHNFKTALQKAVICNETVYRGVSAGNWRADHIQYIRAFIESPTCVTIKSHESASVFKNIGKAFTFTDPCDEERNLAALLIIKPITARYLAPFKHEAKDEGEIVLLSGTKFNRISAKRLPDPKENLEFWELEFEEVI